MKPPTREKRRRPPMAEAIKRRVALKVLGATLGAGAFAEAMAPLRSWAKDLTLDQFLQRNYREMDEAALAEVIRRHEQEALRDHGREVHIGDYRPIEGVSFGYALNLSLCVGCRK